MKIVIAGVVYDPEKIPVTIVFDNDKDLNIVIKHLRGMPPKAEGERAYLTLPDDWPVATDKLIDDAIAATGNTAAYYSNPDRQKDY